jgi:hypothetical protein
MLSIYSILKQEVFRVGSLKHSTHNRNKKANFSDFSILPKEFLKKLM